METEKNNLVKNEPKDSKINKFLADVWDLVKFAIIAIIIVVPIRLFIAQPFMVSGDSMFPTFHNGEYLIVDEISYIVNNPNRGDVVIFRYPNDKKRYFIKRIIGLPNEQIIIKDGTITIINKDNKDGFLLDQNYLDGNFNTMQEYQKFETKNGEYFVMGDNRDRSSDSRFWGNLPEDLLIGRAFLRLFPIRDMSYMPGSLERLTNK
ncbi:TPA: signal peptidase I [Candidatus Nomurabacteria bacterium]|nr:MAG: hypothetical protein O210_OD1C00001G0312 [Parcubacteria bacterium RAAC4_OD1_1]HCY26447.1 signal peptidase I [Candidatus Nomurabacteria bacterium]